MEENEIKEESIAEQKEPKKKGARVLLVLLILIILGLAGYICYDKFLIKNEEPSLPKETEKNPDKKPDEKDVKKSEISINTIEDLKSVDFNESLIGYWNYDDLANYYLKMDSKKFPNEIDDELQKCLKVENKKLYWQVNGKWTLDEKIKGNILGIKAVNSGYDDESYIEIFTDSGYIYIIESGYLADSYKPDNLYKDRKYYEVNYTGKLNGIDYKLFCECECAKTTYISINNQVFVLHANYDEVADEIDGYILTPVNNYIIDFENQNMHCGTRAYRLGTDGYLINVVDENNQKVKVKDYISFDIGDVNERETIDKDGNVVSVDYRGLGALIIDNENNLYIISFENSDINKDVISAKKIDSIKDSKFVYQDDEKSYGYIILSDNFKLEFNEIVDFFYE